MCSFPLLQWYHTIPYIWYFYTVNMDGPQKHFLRGMPDAKDYLLYDSIYMKCLKKAISRNIVDSG